MYTISAIRSNKFCNQENDEVDEFVSKYLLNQTGDRNMGVFKGSISSVLQKGGGAHFGTGNDDLTFSEQSLEYKSGDYLEAVEKDPGLKKEPLNSENADEEFDVESRGENGQFSEDDNTSAESDSSTSDEDKDDKEEEEDEHEHREEEQDEHRKDDNDESGEVGDDDVEEKNRGGTTPSGDCRDTMAGDKRIPHVNVKILNKQLLKHVEELDIDKKTNTIRICLGWSARRCPHYIDFLPALRNTISKTSIQSIPNLRNARITKRNAGNSTDSGERRLSEYEVTVEGTNVGHIFKVSPKYVDHDKIRFNDIQTVYRYYGVEAARQCIINELRNVFLVYGINVNYRHLTLISDSITSSGNLRVFNRSGAICHNVSPFLQMSFETSIRFLTEACLRGARDNLKSPASCISVGGIARVGTGISRTLTEFSVGGSEETNGGKYRSERRGSPVEGGKDLSYAKSESLFKFL
ncbi:RNA polymerase subunit [Cryptosporidium ryanae]|uniref:RNA polymerase subunit n=1 Tax=Cryptosporidium ryanae TaxID=515981 RepID=UPI00351A050C|nr:RNA polymerase subunit [Cryptosporidium ryanae]